MTLPRSYGGTAEQLKLRQAHLGPNTACALLTTLPFIAPGPLPGTLTPWDFGSAVASVNCWIKKKKFSWCNFPDLNCGRTGGRQLAEPGPHIKESQSGNRKQEDGGAILASSLKETQLGLFPGD